MSNDASMVTDGGALSSVPSSASATVASRLVAVLSRWLALLGGLGVAFMCIATVYDVLARYLFNSPTSWATEVSTYLLIAAIFFGAAQTHLLDGNVRVELILHRLTGKSLRMLLLVVAWCGWIVIFIAAWQASLMVLSDYRNGSRIFSLLLTPTWIPKLPIAIGLAALSAALLVEIERLASQTAGWRRAAPYVMAAALACVLVAFGAKPPTLGDSRYDWGSLLVLGVAFVGACVTGGLPACAGVVVATAGGAALLYAGQMIGTGAVSVMLGLAIVASLASGMRIAFAMAFVGLLAIYFLTPIPFPLTVADRTWSSVNSFSLTAVPMFVLMGAFLVRSGLSKELFAVMARLLARLPGGLAHAATAGCGLFAAVSGSSVATAATIGAVACPEMTRRGYSPALAYGTVAAGGTLGILIPPSVPMIIYGTSVGVPVATLFVAGILPGLLMMGCFVAVILAWAWWWPASAPAIDAQQLAPIGRRSFVDTGLLLLLIVLIVATLYLGVATPSETGAIGAFMALLICAARGRLSLGLLNGALAETVTVTSFIFLIVVGANIITFGFDYLKVAQAVMDVATHADLHRWAVMLIIMAVYVVLGMFLDSISMLVLTLPVVFPLATTLGFDPVWFGIVLVIMAEVGLITPPVGMNLFVLQGIGKNVSIRTIALGAIPFIAAMFVTVGLLCAFPDIALWLTRSL